MSVTDNTGAPTTVTAEAGRFTIAVDGKTVGLIDYIDQGGRRMPERPDEPGQFGTV